MFSLWVEEVRVHDDGRVTVSFWRRGFGRETQFYVKDEELTLTVDPQIATTVNREELYRAATSELAYTYSPFGIYRSPSVMILRAGEEPSH